MIKMGSFRSYVDLEEYEMKIPAPMNGSFLQPKFIPGELVIAEATNVLKFTSLSKKKGLSGSLFVTNARVVFVSSDHVCSEDSFPLLSINTLWYYESNTKNATSSTTSVKKTRRKIKLGPMKSQQSGTFYSATSSQQQSSQQNNLIPSSGSTRIHEIFIVCSNFRTLRISFKFSPIDQGLRVCNAIIHHSFPEQLELLFYFDFCKAYNAQWTNARGAAGGGIGGGLANRSFLTIPSYMDKGDWLRELNVTRTTGGGYRISGVNESFQVCGSLPEWIVVPSDVNDGRLRVLAEKLKGNRPPHWTWGDPKGAAILVMGKLNNEADSSAENSFFESLRKVHPKGLAPTIYDLDQVVNLKEIRQSFVALVDLCCPESFSQFQDADSKFYSSLEHTKWLLLISKVLAKSREIVTALIEQGSSIILQEQEGRDVSCLFSSLIQVIIEPRFRTVIGFFSLIQKDWVAFGHPFHSTHLHTSPVFLLFLDSVFQLYTQNALDFEFNDRLLSSLWDSSFDCTTGTFLFDSPQQRKTYELCKDSTAWLSIFSSTDSTSLVTPRNGPPTSPRRDNMLISKNMIPRAFMNPFYQVKTLLNGAPSPGSHTSNAVAALTQLTSSSSSATNTQTLSCCSPIMCDISFWETLYLHRTLEIDPMIVTSGEGVIHTDHLLSKQNTSPGSSSNASPAHSSSDSPSPSPSSKFYFPLPSTSRRRPGRDTASELRVVEDLLSSLSATTRFQRNVPSSSTSTAAISGGGSKGGSSTYSSSSPSSSPAALFQQRYMSSSSSAVGTHRNRFAPGTSSSANSSPVIGNMSRARFAVNSSSTPPVPPRRNPFMNLTST